MFIKLIKAKSYTDGNITVKRENPVVEVADADALTYLNTGFFAVAEGADAPQAVTSESDDSDELLFPEDAPGEDMTAEDLIEIDLEKRTVKELKGYAEEKGIDLDGASKKDAIISVIMGAERKAAEARRQLRQV